MTHRAAVATMVLVTLLWSMAGVVTRQVEQAQGLELTFWRSAFNALALIVILSWRAGGPSGLLDRLRAGGTLLWASGACWAVMFTAFMAALTMTTVANVLLTMALAPLFTALLARLILAQPLKPRTMCAIALAVVGMVWMQAPVLWPDAASALSSVGGEHLRGILVSLAVPLGGALNWIIIRRASGDGRSGAVVGQDAKHDERHGEHLDDKWAPWTLERSTPSPAVGAPDLLPAVLIGAVLSSALTLAWAVPMRATASDLGWLALLGVFQLAVPCLLAVRVARQLSPTEVSLLSLLEVIFGVAWVWIATAEAPNPSVLSGGALVLSALVLNEVWARVET